MDVETAMLAVAIAEKKTESSATRAEEAAQDAAESAAVAATHNYGIELSGKRLVITEPEGEGV